VLYIEVNVIGSNGTVVKESHCANVLVSDVMDVFSKFKILVKLKQYENVPLVFSVISILVKEEGKKILVNPVQRENV